MRTASRQVIVLAVTAVSVFALGPAASGVERLATPAPQAWLHIVGVTPAKGVPIVIAGRPADGRAGVTIEGNATLLSKLKSQKDKGARFRQVQLVVRENPAEERDTVYTLAEVAVESMVEVGARSSRISMRFDKMSVAAALTLNPGVPTGAPAIAAFGRNRGWVHFIETKDPNGMPIEVIAYASRPGSGTLKLTFEAGEAVWARLAELRDEKKPIDMLILLLPDPERRRHVEYKLAKASILSLVDWAGHNKREVVFGSDEIACYTGETP